MSYFKNRSFLIFKSKSILKYISKVALRKLVSERTIYLIIQLKCCISASDVLCPTHYTILYQQAQPSLILFKFRETLSFRLSFPVDRDLHLPELSWCPRFNAYSKVLAQPMQISISISGKTMLCH